MAGGYFRNGTVGVELGEHVFGGVAGRRHLIVRHPAGRPASVMDAGGGIYEIDVTGQRLRDNLGDAERWAYELLRSLVTAAPGRLAWEDNRGYRHVWGDAVCVSARARVSAFRFVSIESVWTAPERSSQPAWESIPPAPAAYAGTSTSQNYAAGGTALGQGVRLEIGAVRDWSPRVVSRARGGRQTDREHGAVLSYHVDSYVLADASALDGEIDDLVRSIGTQPVDLTGNGNTYEGVVLAGHRHDRTDVHVGRISWEFRQGL